MMVCCPYRPKGARYTDDGLFSLPNLRREYADEGLLSLPNLRRGYTDDVPVIPTEPKEGIHRRCVCYPYRT